jgi:hypothetical protein
MMEELNDSINNRLDCAVVDGGIGSYEAGDGQYTDIREYLCLTTEEVMLECEDNEEPIEKIIRGVLNDGESGLELCWMAELKEVQWDSNKKCYITTYILQQV